MQADPRRIAGDQVQVRAAALDHDRSSRLTS
jgi:hypothetical protein